MKTGTNSLAQALSLLGYDAVRAESEEEIHSHEAATDTLVACRYQALDERYPLSKFILTVRDVDTWLVSCKRHFEAVGDIREVKQTPRVMEYIYARQKLGIPYTYDSDALVLAYVNHVDGMLMHFAGSHRTRLLIYSLCDGPGWGPLCEFLGKPVPTVGFPWLNRGASA